MYDIVEKHPALAAGAFFLFPEIILMMAGVCMFSSVSKVEQDQDSSAQISNNKYSDDGLTAHLLHEQAVLTPDADLL
jgi:hypothetical protein